MKKIVILVLGFIFLVTAAELFAVENPRIGVLRFSNNTQAYWWSSNTASELQDLLTNELAATKAFQILERKELGSSLSEQQLSESGLVNSSTRLKLGKITVCGYGVNIVENIVTPSASPSPRKIIGGKVAFSLSSNNPVTGDVMCGDFRPFIKFNIATSGDGITVTKISLTVNNTAGDPSLAKISGIRLWTKTSSGTWLVVAGPKNPVVPSLLSSQKIAYTDNFDVPAATTQEFMVTADIANSASTGWRYDIDVANVTIGANTELEYLSDGTRLNVNTEVRGGMLNGNVMTVKHLK